MTRLLVTALGLSLIVSLAHAAEAPTKPAPTAADIAQKHAEAFKRGDANGDGSITKEEFTARTLKRFDQIDTTRDGKISPAEMKTHRDAQRIKRAQNKAKRSQLAPANTPAAAPAAK